MAVQQLGLAASGPTDITNKTYVDSLLASGIARTKTSTAAAQWTRIARVTLTAQGAGVNGNVDVVLSASSLLTTTAATFKFRTAQTAAFGSAPAVDIALQRAMNISTSMLGWVVVQNTPTTIIDLYVQLAASGTSYQIAPGAVNVGDSGAAIQWLYQDTTQTTTTPSGIVFATPSTENMYSVKGDLPPQEGCPVGWYLGPNGVYLTGVATATTGVWCYNPVNVSFGGGTFDAFVSNLTTARAGGTATATIFALHADDGTGFPDTSNWLAWSTVLVSTTGKVITTFGTPQTLAPGLYWIGSLYYAGTTAPTTQEQFTSISGMTMTTALSPTIGVGSSMRGLRSSAATFTTTPATKITTANMITQTGATSHYVMLRRSA